MWNGFYLFKAFYLNKLQKWDPKKKVLEKKDFREITSSLVASSDASTDPRILGPKWAQSMPFWVREVVHGIAGFHSCSIHVKYSPQMFMFSQACSISGWWFLATPLKNMSHVGWCFPIVWINKEGSKTIQTTNSVLYSLEQCSKSLYFFHSTGWLIGIPLLYPIITIPNIYWVV